MQAIANDCQTSHMEKTITKTPLDARVKTSISPVDAVMRPMHVSVVESLAFHASRCRDTRSFSMQPGPNPTLYFAQSCTPL